jgi:hypothetical protein
VRQRGKGASPGLIRVAALVVVGAGLFFAWKQFGSKPAPTPAPAAKAAPVKKAPTSATSAAPLTPSDTLNQLAHLPKNAIDKAQASIDAHRASGQSRVDAASIGEDLPAQPVASAPAATTAASTPASRPAQRPVTTTTIAPGVAATAQVDAGPEASPAFRTYVANAKVSGVFQGPPTRAMINGRLTRTGEVLDATLGITFNGVDSARRHLLFVDRTGATVTRRF